MKHLIGTTAVLLLASLTSSGVAAAESPRCTGESCFHFFRDERSSWEEAEQICIKQGMHLARATKELEVILWSHADLGNQSFWTDQDQNPQWNYEGQLGDEFGDERTGCGVLQWDFASSSHRLTAVPCSEDNKVLCQTDYPLECTLSNTGQEYMGNQNKSLEGMSCVAWNYMYRYVEFGSWHFPDGDAESAGTRCRNPDDNVLGPWCRLHSRHDLLAMQYCDIPSCVEQELCFSKASVSNDSVWCEGEHCYVATPTGAAKTWRDAAQCCRSFTSGRLATLDPTSPQLVEGLKLRARGMTLWLDLTNGDWTPDMSQPDSFLCPYMRRGFANHSNIDCDARQGFICRAEIQLQPTPQPSPAPVPAPVPVPSPASTPAPTETTTTSSSSSSSSSSSFTTATADGGVVEAQSSMLTGNNVIYLGAGIAAAIVLTAVILLVVAVYCRRPKSGRPRTVLRRERSSSSTQTFINGDTDNEYMVGVPNGTAVPMTQTTSTSTSTGTGTSTGTSTNTGTSTGTSTNTGTQATQATQAPKPALQRTASTDSATQTDTDRSGMPLPLPPKENIYSHVYDRPRPLTCRPK